MNSKQRMFLAAALVAVAAAIWYRSSVMSAEGEPPRTPVHLVFVTGGSGPYWQLAASGARDAGEDLDADVRIETPSGAESVAEQTAILEKIDAAATGGVAVSPLDAAGQTELIDKLAKESLVVTFDSDAPDSKRIAYVGTSNFAAGRVCARLVAEALPDGGQIAVLMANQTKDNLLDRQGGFAEILRQLSAGANKDGPADTPAKWAIVGYFVDDGDDDKCAANIRDLLADHPDVDCIVGMNARHGPVLMEVLEAEDQLGKLKLVTFDEDPKTLAGVEAGHIYATVAQDPYKFGYEAVRMLTELCRGSETEQPIGAATYSVSVEPVKQDNLEAYREKLRARQKGEAAKEDAA
jgi:ribose transport system substrate-binding protein